RKVLRAAPELALPREADPRDAGPPRGAVRREATTPSRRSLSSFLRASRGRPASIFGKTQSGLLPASRPVFGSAARKLSRSDAMAGARVRCAHSWVLRPKETCGCPYLSPHAGPGGGNAREESAAHPRKDPPHR